MLLSGMIRIGQNGIFEIPSEQGRVGQFGIFEKLSVGEGESTCQESVKNSAVSESFLPGALHDRFIQQAV